MGTVRRLARAAGDVTLGQAADAYLVTLGGAEQASTRRTYGRILRRVVAQFGAETAPDEVDAERFAAGRGRVEHDAGEHRFPLRLRRGSRGGEAQGQARRRVTGGSGAPDRLIPYSVLRIGGRVVGHQTERARPDPYQR
jgi:hypothetical protein